MADRANMSQAVNFEPNATHRPNGEKVHHKQPKKLYYLHANVAVVRIMCHKTVS